MDRKLRFQRTRRIDEFIRAHLHLYDVRLIWRILEVTHRRNYAWPKQPQSNRATENARWLQLIRATLTASNGMYGSPSFFLGLRAPGETCSTNGVAQLTRTNHMRPVKDYCGKLKVGARTPRLDRDSTRGDQLVIDPLWIFREVSGDGDPSGSIGGKPESPLSRVPDCQIGTIEVWVTPASGRSLNTAGSPYLCVAGARGRR